ncbi:MAG: hypothetical protein Q4G39_00850 [Brachymonas sp.]|nr:hypothetical protein [Brachymonas sp.]
MNARISCLALACATLLGVSAPAFAQNGTLQFQANGEELTTKGFRAPKLTKDGWALKFTNVYVALSDVTAYQTSAPYDADKNGDIPVKSQVALPGMHVVDLVKGADKEGLVPVGQVQAPAGHYNAISWKVTPAKSGPAAGYATVFVGKATKAGKTVDFKLVSKEGATYRCGEYVGDERKGFLAANGKSNMEMTFHLDHIFGDASAGAGHDMNKTAVGFAPFAKGGTHTIALKGKHIGHAGEGHCNVQWH